MPSYQGDHSTIVLASRMRGSRNSIETKLPLAIGVLWLVAIVVLSSVAYVHVTGAARDAANARLQTAAQNTAGMLGVNAQQIVAAAGEVASQPAAGDYLANSGDSSARRSLERLLTDTLPRRRIAGLALWTTNDEQVLALGSAAGGSHAELGQRLIHQAASDSAAIGPFLRFGDTVVVPVAVPAVRAGQRIGYLVEWRYVTGPRSQREQILALLGPGSALYIGSRATEVWTDLVTAVPPPPQGVESDTALARYTRASSGGRIGAMREVPGTPWSVLVEFSDASVVEPAHQFLIMVSLLGAAVLIVGLIGVWLVTRRITQRLQNLTDAAELVSAASTPTEPAMVGGDELERLGAAFDRMAARVEESHTALEANLVELKSTREQFAHAQRMDAVGRLAGGVAHDFNNLLTVILGGVGLTLDNATPEDRELLEDMQAAAQRAEGLTRQLLAFSRRQVVAPTIVDVNQLITDLKRMLDRLIGEHINLVTRPMADPATVRADRGQLEQVVVNLVLNSRDAMESGGDIVVETRTVALSEEYASTRTDTVPGEYVTIAVSDTGTGMTEEVQRHLFEPFFTTKEHGRGTGLGLATCYGIVKQSGGHIGVYSEAGVGTTMRVYMPLVGEAPGAAAAPELVPPSGSETILLVEDEAAVRRIATRILEARGYRVVVAGDATEALAILRAGNEAIQLLLTDIVLPGMGGRELAEQAAVIAPSIKILFASGYTDDMVLRQRLVADEVPFIQKPFTMGELSRKVREVLDNDAASAPLR